MTKFSFTFLVFICSFLPCIAQRILDSLAVTKLYGTSWTLREQFKSNKRDKLHKIDSIAPERITFYDNEIHWDIEQTPYQICVHRLRNQNEFWIDCRVADQIIYRIVKIDGDVLEIDVLARPYGSQDFKRTARKIYRCAKI